MIIIVFGKLLNHNNRKADLNTLYMRRFLCAEYRYNFPDSRTIRF